MLWMRRPLVGWSLVASLACGGRDTIREVHCDDDDGDGRCNTQDLCRGDDLSGDEDADGVCDDIDVCSGGDDAMDVDGDGVPDGCDLCASTGPGEVVDENGCPDEVEGDRDTDTGACPSSSTHAPVVNAGADRIVHPGTFVDVEGDAQDEDGDPLAFSWVLLDAPEGSSASLENADYERATAYVDLVGVYTFQFSASDCDKEASDTMMVTAIDGNVPPTADAGFDQDACIGDTVQLSGAGSADADGDAMSYHWNFRQKPACSGAQLFGAGPPSAAISPYFIPDASGSFIIELVVKDAMENASLPDAVTVTVRDCSGSSNGPQDTGPTCPE